MNEYGPSGTISRRRRSAEYGSA